MSANNGPGGVLRKKSRAARIDSMILFAEPCTRPRRIFSWRQIAVSGWPLLNLAKAPEMEGLTGLEVSTESHTPVI